MRIKFVKDRPGHDVRYALSSNKINKKIKWYPSKKFNEGLEETLSWYSENYNFFENLSKKRFFKRLGLKI